ncbi:DUF924 family protein [Lysobacter sp. KIS68-7]|uniref:DUF924 family protein n=1 Tax=Lysobacter sp. KIS68-7 TaxID=2904252 RepID=UPI001E2AC628|nr:DUF924 family protein [Lysobacter sp. KIS68-7]UHQ20636.1 DUF924 family protein [Lysobacter sp. KIS68-7]
MLDAIDIVSFWREAGPKKWFNGGAAFDRECEANFFDAHFAAALRTLDAWIETPDEALALLLLLDQIPRNIFRDTAHAFATDPLARDFARQAVAAGHDKQVDAQLRIFFYLPFEHSEDLDDQEFSLRLHAELPGPNPDGWARKHYEVIRKFGRFPHRNAALGRQSTPAEFAYLREGGGF